MSDEDNIELEYQTIIHVKRSIYHIGKIIKKGGSWTFVANKNDAGFLPNLTAKDLSQIAKLVREVEKENQ